MLQINDDLKQCREAEEQIAFVEGQMKSCYALTAHMVTFWFSTLIQEFSLFLNFNLDESFGWI